MRQTIIAAALLTLLLSAPAFAAKKTAVPKPSALVSSAQPVEVSAAGALVWNRKAHSYTMKKNAQAKQGNFQLNSDTLTARYHDEKDATDIYVLEASGNVVLQSPPYTAYGDHATYDVKTGMAELTGENLRIETPTQKLTAKDKITFDAQNNKMTAPSGGTAVRGPDTLTADALSAYFAKDAQGKLAVNRMTAKGHVVIKTQKETVYGDDGTYDIPAQKAVLTGKVRILQGPNWLEGTKAVVDLKTGISQLFATDNPATENRVYGVFYPKASGGPKGAKPAGNVTPAP